MKKPELVKYKPELVEESKKLPCMVTLTAKQEFAQKSEKPLCLTATTAMWELVVRSEKLETATLSWEKRSLWSCHNLLRINAFFVSAFPIYCEYLSLANSNSEPSRKGILGKVPGFCSAKQRWYKMGGCNAKLTTNLNLIFRDQLASQIGLIKEIYCVN